MARKIVPHANLVHTSPQSALSRACASDVLETRKRRTLSRRPGRVAARERQHPPRDGQRGHPRTTYDRRISFLTASGHLTAGGHLPEVSASAHRLTTNLRYVNVARSGVPARRPARHRPDKHGQRRVGALHRMHDRGHLYGRGYVHESGFSGDGALEDRRTRARGLPVHGPDLHGEVATLRAAARAGHRPRLV